LSLSCRAADDGLLALACSVMLAGANRLRVIQVNSMKKLALPLDGVLNSLLYKLIYSKLLN
jgi:hypothetical protein